MTVLLPTDSSMTVQLVTPIFMKMHDWTSIGKTDPKIVIIPNARADVIRMRCSSIFDQRKEAAAYFVNVYIHASWERLAHDLYFYYLEENEAMQAFKDNLPKRIGN